MGLFDGIRKKQERRKQEAALEVLNPYVLLLQSGDVTWMRWEVLPAAEAIGVFPRIDDLPILMTKEECRAVNGGVLPEYWGELQYAWRSEAQRQRFASNVRQQVKPTLDQSLPTVRSYVVEGLKLTKRLITILELGDWESGIPSYTSAESRAIEEGLRSYYTFLEDSDSGESLPKIHFDSESSNSVRRALASDALHILAGKSIASLDGCPEDWRSRVSTYLKAWAMQLHPSVMLDLAQLLALAGLEAEAREAAEIVAYGFPAYAPRYYSKTPDAKIVDPIIARGKSLILKISTQGKLNRPEQVRDYPTHEQIKELWDAHKSGGKEAIAEVLRSRREVGRE